MSAAEKDMTDVEIICCGIYNCGGKKRKRRVFNQIITRIRITSSFSFLYAVVVLVCLMIRLHYLHRGGGGDKLFSHHSSAVWLLLLLGANGRNQISKCDTPKCCYMVVLNIHTQLNTENSSTGRAWKYKDDTVSSTRVASPKLWGRRGSLVSPNTANCWRQERKEKKRKKIF